MPQSAPRKAGSIPVFSEDLFSDGALRDPFPLYRRVRNLGPVVMLQDRDIYAIGRFDDVRTALRSPDALISSKGVAFNDIVNAERDEPPMIVSDGERHRRLRGPVARQIAPQALKPRRSSMRQVIQERVDELVGAGWVEGVTAIAQHLPLTVVSKLVGLPNFGRENMMKWAAASFNLVGPRIDGREQDIVSLQEVRTFLKEVSSSDLKEGSWGHALFEHSGLSHDHARAALEAFVLPSLDTTAFAQANLLYNFATHPDQWELLKSNPTLISASVMESMRYSAVVRWFSRFSSCNYDCDGVTIPAGSRIMIMYASANRDERHYKDPDKFDISRNPSDQLGWGTGPHMCAGMHLAKLEMEVLLEALLESVRLIEAGEPVVGCNQGLYGYQALPLRLS